MRLALSSTAGALAPLAWLALSATAPPALAQPAPGTEPLAPPAIGPPPAEASPQANPAAGAAWVPDEVPDVRPPGATPASEPDAAPEDRTVARPERAGAAAVKDKAGAQAPARKPGRGVFVMMLIGDGLLGIRGELELWSVGGWSGGLVVGYSTLEIANDRGDARFAFGDLRGVVTAGYTLGRGDLRLRTQAAFGAVRTELTGSALGVPPVSYKDTYPFGESSVQVHLAFGLDRAWALAAGPVLSIFSQRFLLDNDERMRDVSRAYDVSFAVGVRRRL